MYRYIKLQNIGAQWHTKYIIKEEDGSTALERSSVSGGLNLVTFDKTIGRVSDSLKPV